MCNDMVHCILTRTVNDQSLSVVNIRLNAFNDAEKARLAVWSHSETGPQLTAATLKLSDAVRCGSQGPSAD